jgi:hypothetical protein
MEGRRQKLPSASIVFADREWAEEVERLEPAAASRASAENARREIEVADRQFAWRPCEAVVNDGTRLPGCRKLYVPLDQEGASAAPYGFIFQLA